LPARIYIILAKIKRLLAQFDANVVNRICYTENNQNFCHLAGDLL